VERCVIAAIPRRGGGGSGAMVWVVMPASPTWSQSCW
jgi:hypothetical protein